MNQFVVLLSLAAAILAEDDPRKPVYKYRYETEDLMKTAASSVPVRGYHVVEGGYYPSEIGLSGAGAGVGVGGGGYGGGIGIGGGGFGGSAIGLGGGQFIGGGGKFIGGGLGGGQFIGGGAGGGQFIGGGAGGGQFIGGGAGGQFIGGGAGGQFIGGGAGGQFIGGGAGGGQLIGGGGAGGQFIGGGGQFIGGGLHHGYGGEVIDKNIYSGEKKNLNDEKYEKASGKNGAEVNHGQEGYSKGIAAVKNNKGESGYYNDVSNGKKVAEDGKNYYGGQQFNKEGKQGGEENVKSGHKKGHVIKGFKTSHHKDENGKTEEFYDEENDEGGKLHFNGQSGSFGEKGASSFKGGHENGEFAAGGHKKQSHFDNEHLVDNNKADEGKYGEKKYSGSGSVYGSNNGVDQQSLLGHQEANHFYKHHPYHVPFY